MSPGSKVKENVLYFIFLRKTFNKNIIQHVMLSYERYFYVFFPVYRKKVEVTFSSNTCVHNNENNKYIFYIATSYLCTNFLVFCYMEATEALAPPPLPMAWWTKELFFILK